MIHHRVLFSIAVLVIGSIIIFVSVMRNTRPSSTNSVDNQLQNINLSQLLSRESTESSQLYSILPNPGFLPDSPIYWLKMIRDRINLLTTFDSEAKTKLMILYANKRLHSGLILINKQQTQLGITTITKAEKYLNQVHNLINKSSIQQDTIQLYKNTLLLHNSILQDLIANSEIQDKTVLNQMLELNSSLLNQYPNTDK